MAPSLIVYRPGWRLTWLGWLAGLLGLVLLVFGAARCAYPFLAPNRPVTTDCLVIEGWVPDTAIEPVIEEMARGQYTRIYLTGGPIRKNEPGSRFGSYPELMKAALIHHGARPEVLFAVPSSRVVKDRTYASAMALCDWLKQRRLNCPSFNLLTEGPHARRSQLLFGKAFGSQTGIGMIPVTPDDYDPKGWWRTSAGVREVIGESIAYVYARFFFQP